MKVSYHCLIFEQNDFFKNQVIEELLRERANYYISKNRFSDFWVLLNPLFLKNNKISEKIENTNYFKNKVIKKPEKFFSTLISTDIEFIKWIKLRIGYFEELEKPLAKESFKSNGIYLELNSSFILENESILKNKYNCLSPEILVKQLESFVYN
jgi:hypothetical protein